MSQLRHVQTYRQNQVQTADPGTVLLLLYQGAIDALERASEAIARGDAVEKGRHIRRAHNIILEFLTSLDLEAGGEVAANLERLYVYMLDCVTAANIGNTAGPLEEVVSLLRTLQTAWQGAVAEQRKRTANGEPA